MFMKSVPLKAAIALCILVAVAGGCSRKIVKPTPQQPGPTVPHHPGSIAEAPLEAVQAQLKEVYFGYDTYVLTPEAQAALQYNAELLRRAPQAKVVAEGHCDERGTDEYNLALGERRARSVVDYLVTLGVEPHRLSTVSYGEELPVDPGHNEAAWAKNRRVYLRVTQ